MKRYSIVCLAFLLALGLSYCSSTKKAVVIPKLSYEQDIQQLVQNKCAPCHIPAKGGNKLPLDNYTATKDNIDEILRRVHLNPGEKGFMPFKRPKLTDSTIAVLQQWKSDGLIK